MKHFINLKDIPAIDLRKILIDSKIRKNQRKKLNTLEREFDEKEQRWLELLEMEEALKKENE